MSPASKQRTHEILSQLPAAHRRLSMKWAGWSALAAAACLAVAFPVAFNSRRMQSPPSPTSTPYAITAPRVELTRTWTQLVEAPLANEAHNLSANAQSGLRFLVACLNVRPAAGAVTPSPGESAPPPVQ